MSAGPTCPDCRCTLRVIRPIGDRYYWQCAYCARVDAHRAIPFRRSAPFRNRTTPVFPPGIGWIEASEISEATATDPRHPFRIFVPADNAPTLPRKDHTS